MPTVMRKEIEVDYGKQLEYSCRFGAGSQGARQGLCLLQKRVSFAQSVDESFRKLGAHH